MKAELTKGGYIKITAETIVEAHAINGVYHKAEHCEHCGCAKNWIIDNSILNFNETDLTDLTEEHF